MKLIIQVPCCNEAETLPFVFKDMPRQIEGIDTIEYQIIDDGCTDQTVEVAKALGVHHVVTVRGRNRRWLGRAFKMGIDHALKLGADIVVNTDGDNQYPSSRIVDLVKPIVRGEVDIVIGDRAPGKVEEFSPLKRVLQRVGSGTVAMLSGEDVPDAVSGFRAYSKEALEQLHVITNYTYTVDTLIQAHKKGIDICWVPIQPNRKTRESRLITSLANKVRKSGFTILRLSTVYRPFVTFLGLGALFLIPGFLLLLRFLYFYLFVPSQASGHIQSVIIAGVALVVGVQMVVLGIIGDLLSVNRTLVEDLLRRVRGIEAVYYSSKIPEQESSQAISNSIR